MHVQKAYSIMQKGLESTYLPERTSSSANTEGYKQKLKSSLK